MSEDIGKEINWTSHLETYFKQTGEKAYGLSLLHKRSETKYNHYRTFIDLPVIILSSITGFLSVGSTQMFPSQDISSIALGVASLFVSVLNTTGSYFAWSKRAEGHRISAIQYGKLYRFLAVELGLPREERMSPHDLLKFTKDQYDRLQEVSPPIPPDVLRSFKHDFKSKTEIAKPEEANGLESISIYSSDGVTYQSNPLREQTLRQTSSEIKIQVPPETPANMCILGRVGTGKSSCMYSLLSKGYVNGKKSVFDEMVFYIGNQESDHAIQQLPCKNIAILHEFDAASFDNYVEDLRKHQLERLEKKKPPLNICLVFDDMATADLLKKVQGKSPLASLLLTSRHELNATVIVLSQIYKTNGFSTPMIRNNVTTWIVYNMSKPEWSKIAEDHANDFTVEELTARYEHAMAKPHNFICIDYRRPLDSRITERFTTIMRPGGKIVIQKQNAESPETSDDEGSGSSSE